MLLVFLAAAANAFLVLLLLQASQTQRERSDTASKALNSVTQRFGSAAAAFAMAAAVLTTPTAAMADLVQVRSQQYVHAYQKHHYSSIHTLPAGSSHNKSTKEPKRWCR
jgi:hypothetical protein